ncbi:MAG: TrkH family potassium uptake protein, partial [Alistipes sp.]|nr:TrkH family potassium uptake protein [Alistipes sp.]
MRVHVVIRYIGMVLVFIAAFMLASAGVSLVNNTDSAYYPLLLSSFLTALLGVFPLIFVPRAEQIKTKEGYCIVVGSWLVACIVGMFPYLTWGGEFSPMNAWFESVSGFTTTGASILNDVEDLPRGLLFWRMSTAWIGGIGVVMFALVILPSMGKNKLLLSNVELSTIAKDNYKYRTQVILRILIFVYVGLTLVTTLLLKLAGMCWFDAATHAMSACSTCGFGTKNASVAFFDSVSVEVILIAAMTLAGIHFGLLYATIIGRRNNIFRSEVVRVYLCMMLVISIVIAMSLWSDDVYSSFPESLRRSVFHVVSVTTTSGFAIADTNTWTSLAVILLIS